MPRELPKKMAKRQKKFKKLKKNKVRLDDLEDGDITKQSMNTLKNSWLRGVEGSWVLRIQSKHLVVCMVLTTPERLLRRRMCHFFFDFIYLFSPFGRPVAMEFLSQGSDLSHNCDLSCTCGNARSLTLGAQARNQTSQ